MNSQIVSYLTSAGTPLQASLGKPLPTQERGSGSNGGSYFSTSSGAQTGNWYCIQTIATTTLTSLTGNLTGIAGVSIPAGTLLYGNFTGLQVSSGGVIAFNS